MKSLASYLVVGALALVAALANAHGDPGMADVHVATAARGQAMFAMDWLQPLGR